MAHVILHYVEFHFADGSTSNIKIENRTIDKVDIPEGAVKYRFFDKKILDNLRFNPGKPIENDFDFSEFFEIK